MSADDLPIRRCEKCGEVRRLVERRMESGIGGETYVSGGTAYYASCKCASRQPLDAEDRVALGFESIP